MIQHNAITQPNRLEMIRFCLEASRQVEVRTILLEKMRARIEELRFARSEQLAELARQVRSSVRMTAKGQSAPELPEAHEQAEGD
jgi:hypothetical protein